MNNNLAKDYYKFFTNNVENNIIKKILLIQTLFHCQYIQNEISSYLFVPFKKCIK